MLNGVVLVRLFAPSRVCCALATARALSPSRGKRLSHRHPAATSTRGSSPRRAATASRIVLVMIPCRAPRSHRRGWLLRVVAGVGWAVTARGVVPDALRPLLLRRLVPRLDARAVDRERRRPRRAHCRLVGGRRPAPAPVDLEAHHGRRQDGHRRRRASQDEAASRVSAGAPRRRRAPRSTVVVLECRCAAAIGSAWRRGGGGGAGGGGGRERWGRAWHRSRGAVALSGRGLLCMMGCVFSAPPSLASVAPMPPPRFRRARAPPWASCLLVKAAPRVCLRAHRAVTPRTADKFLDTQGQRPPVIAGSHRRILKPGDSTMRRWPPSGDRNPGDMGIRRWENPAMGLVVELLWHNNSTTGGGV